ncbi:MAG: 2-isopropylmalate synthase [Solirubrobacterales bacterium]|nr:2-isopropylmalate synthase [Solirubrobacterales bacterium]
MTSNAHDDANRVILFDTTLRDGEQSPGISLNGAEKLEIAHQLARLGVDVIEAGFPIASPGDFEAVQGIAREVVGPVICGLARANPQDIDREDVVLSVHCHDDLGLAVANSLAGLQAGARQIECAVNGIGERAGNASLEELIMLLHTRRADLGYHTGAVTTEIARTSRLVSRLTGYPVQPNKAVVGRNAFAHESGIHQDGVLKERTTYEIMDARTVGLDANSIVLGKHSGRHALRQALEDLGYKIDGAALNHAFQRFKEIADRKKQVTAMDLEALVTDELREEIPTFAVEWFDVEASTRRPPHATVAIRTPAGQTVEGSFTGDGPVDAIFRAINSATGIDARLRDYRVDAVTGGQDALGEVSVVVELGNPEDAVKADIPGVLAGQRVTGAGQAVATDIIEASATAYVRALSNAVGKAQAAADAAPDPAELARTP